VQHREKVDERLIEQIFAESQRARGELGNQPDEHELTELASCRINQPEHQRTGSFLA
jgi:hypothetical protein